MQQSCQTLANSLEYLTRSSFLLDLNLVRPKFFLTLGSKCQACSVVVELKTLTTDLANSHSKVSCMHPSNLSSFQSQTSQVQSKRTSYSRPSTATTTTATAVTGITKETASSVTRSHCSSVTGLVQKSTDSASSEAASSDTASSDATSSEAASSDTASSDAASSDAASSDTAGDSV